MTKLKSTKRVLIAAVVCIAAAATFLVINSRGSRPSEPVARQNQSNDDAAAVRRALSQGGIREAAKLKGNYIAEHNPHWDWGQFSVEELTKNSAAVIVGRFTKKLDARLMDGKVIFT